MVMNKYIQTDRGYTLIETLVAMAIFVSVLIPLGVTIGNFILDRSPETAQKALHCAQSEMSRVIDERDFVPSIGDSEKDGFHIRRQVEESGYTADITISVSAVGKPARILVTLHKTILVYNDEK
jgi:prepilin-type N-terminal cleavage/methylation domain-containing protein